jgi:3D-(3,5/4)-trihydroxycyclohexane-1,2-dione acylhydrolase (decyclizing)
MASAYIHIYGDETTYGEGYNMQQVPKEEQGLFGRIAALFGRSYVLHTPSGLRDALRRGALQVFHPYRAGPFYLLLPINTQPAIFTLNAAALPGRPALPAMAPDGGAIDEAAALISRSAKVVIKAGGGTRGHDEAVRRLAKAAGAVVVLSPGSTGVPFAAITLWKTRL